MRKESKKPPINADYFINLSQIPKTASELARKLGKGGVLALIGPLGAGKTTFTQLLGKKLGIKRHITSPTFSIVNRYPLKKQTESPRFFYHMDLYRLKDETEAEKMGLYETWQQPQNVIVIEWADKIPGHLPKQTRYLYFTGLK